MMPTTVPVRRRQGPAGDRRVRGRAHRSDRRARSTSTATFHHAQTASSTTRPADEGVDNAAQHRAAYRVNAGRRRGRHGSVINGRQLLRRRAPGWARRSTSTATSVYMNDPGFQKVLKTRKPWVRFACTATRQLNCIAWDGPLLARPARDARLPGALVGPVQFVKEDDSLGARARLYRRHHRRHEDEGLIRPALRPGGRTRCGAADRAHDALAQPSSGSTTRRATSQRSTSYMPARAPHYKGVAQTTIRLRPLGHEGRASILRPKGRDGRRLPRRRPSLATTRAEN